MATNLEQYLRANYKEGIFEFRICCHVGENVAFYVHPLGKDGATLDFTVSGNELSLKSVACPAAAEGVELAEVRKAVDEVCGGDIDAALAGGLIDQEIADELKAAKA